ncbi:MAG: flagellar hook protein FlgE [Bacillota bacterium]|nr:flagellar hook protein FlgE [Bacillota bacterium]MDD3850130.1 flagellar hook protein FlgE [Bacillota bacterium]MDD4706853.1 flagellar hook protein FlgE [Bacillota bacterium]
MMRSLFSGVSGLRSHQSRMDVIGNNISNVNTVGYKSSRATFQEIFSETLRGAGAPEGGRGGTNPQQIGLGISLASIDTLHTRGSIESTGYPLDLAIEGNGFFIVSDGGAPKFTRAGNFIRDTEGNIVNGNGFRVLGWMADANGNIDTTVSPGTIQIPEGMAMQPKATSAIKMVGNLNADLPTGGVVPFETEIYDELGRKNKLSFELVKVNDNTWEIQERLSDPANPAVAGAVAVTRPDGTVESVSLGAAPTLTFVDGKLTSDGTFEIQVEPNLIPDPITVNIADVHQYAAESGVDPLEVDGYALGSLEDFNFDASGVATGIFSNGQEKVIARIALAAFNNPSGLQKVGSNLFIQTPNSGQPSIGIAGDHGRGTINPSSLEMSNVDISKEFTDMIITQRGFQANSRIITTSDEMLQELVNLKR